MKGAFQEFLGWRKVDLIYYYMYRSSHMACCYVSMRDINRCFIVYCPTSPSQELCGTHRVFSEFLQAAKQPLCIVNVYGCKRCIVLLVMAV